MAKAALTFTEWREEANRIHARADRVRDMITARARATCAAAGLDPTLLGIHPHNAMVSFDYGHPWAGIDYRLVRRTLWLCNRSFEPGRIADRVTSRSMRRVVWP